MRRNLLLSVIAVLAIGLTASAAPAFAESWKPEKEAVTIKNVGDIVLELENSAKLECTGATATGNTGVKSEEISFTPTITGCTFPLTVTGPWSLLAITKTLATLMIPANGIDITVSSTCLLENTSALELDVVWTTGKPSLGVISAEDVVLTKVGTGCPAGSNLGLISATLEVTGSAGGAVEP
jgi:hypothetical protein